MSAFFCKKLCFFLQCNCSFKLPLIKLTLYVSKEGMLIYCDECEHFALTAFLLLLAFAHSFLSLWFCPTAF